MSLVVLGSSFKTSPLEVREQLAIGGTDMNAALKQLVAYEGVNEAAILSTCNRIELYADAKTDRIALDALHDFVEQQLGSSFDPDYFYHERGDDAVEHLMRVVCSLDSQVLGEAQILGQAKRAFQQATDVGTCGVVLTKLFKTALHLGKRVRTETGIGQDSVSLSTTAFKMACEHFPDLSQRCIVVLGTGEMAQLALKYLAGAGCSKVHVVGRDPQKAQMCSSLCPCTFVPVEERYSVLGHADVVFAMTSSEEPVVCADQLAASRMQAAHENEPLLIVDEALPRDVEQECASLEHVTLHNLETLGAIIDEAAIERFAAVGEVERLVSEAHHDFLSWMQQRQVNPTIKQMYEKYTETVDAQVEQAVKALEAARGSQLSEQERNVLDSLGSALVKRLLHGPTSRLRLEAKSAGSYYYTGAARYLFGLETFPPGQGNKMCMHQCEKGQECPHGVPDVHRRDCAGMVSA